jgi:hypothetical protein
MYYLLIIVNNLTLYYSFISCKEQCTKICPFMPLSSIAATKIQHKFYITKTLCKFADCGDETELNNMLWRTLHCGDLHYNSFRLN